jgi:hypothetical protein
MKKRNSKRKQLNMVAYACKTRTQEDCDIEASLGYIYYISKRKLKSKNTKHRVVEKLCTSSN